MKRAISLSLVCVLLLSACGPRQGQNQYSEDQVGVSRAVEFGTVLNTREVDIAAKDTQMGALGGGAVGAGAASYIGNGSGSVWAAAAGAVAGAVAGHYAEQGLSDRTGYEYTVQMQSGEVKTIVQEKGEKDIVFKEGDKVMLQHCDAGDKARKCSEGGYQRLLPIKKLPPYVKKKRKVVQTSEY